MKKKFIRKIVTVISFLPVSVFAQNSYTVCNDTAVKADYATLQGAIDSVAAGSTLYIFPTVNDYGSVIIHKKLFIIGTGFMLDQNSEPYTNPNQEGVTVSSIYIGTGSDNTYIEGLQMLGDIGPLNGDSYRFFLDSVNNITINRCMTDVYPGFGSANEMFRTRNTSNCIVSQCYITQLGLININHSAGEFYKEIGTGSQNFTFTNNIIDNRGNTATLYINHNISNANFGNVNFTYNTFYIGVPLTDFSNYNYYNNIFISSDTTTAIVANNVRMNGAAAFNVTNLTNFFPGSGNYQGVSIDSMSVINTFGYHSWDQRWQVPANSSLNHSSSSNTEVGAFGGANPYVLSGIPALPNTYNLTITRDGNNRGNVLVHIKAKAITN